MVPPLSQPISWSTAVLRTVLRCLFLCRLHKPWRPQPPAARVTVGFVYKITIALYTLIAALRSGPLLHRFPGEQLQHGDAVLLRVPPRRHQPEQFRRLGRHRNRRLQVVGEVFPEMYEEYLSAPPRKRARIAHALLTYSMTIILCADGDGPLPEGHPMEGVLTGAGLDDVGRSAFHINDWTLQYHLDRFPEVQQYRRNRAAQRRFGLIGMRPLPLSSALEQAILDRAAEAFSYLD